MKNLFIKKNWDEEDILFYLHFQNGEAIRQIEIKDGVKLFLTQDNPQIGDSGLYDQSLDELDLTESDFIEENEFNEIWDN